MDITTLSDQFVDAILNSKNWILVGLIVLIALVVVISKIRQTAFQKSLMEFDSNLRGFNNGKIIFICNENDETVKKTIDGYQSIIEMNNKKDSNVETEIKFETFQKAINGVWLESKTDNQIVVRMYALNPNK